MSLFAETFSDAFNFWSKYFLKLFLYQLFFLLFFGLSFGIILLGIFTVRVPTDITSSFSFLILLIIGIIISIIFGFAQGGGYSLIVKRAFKNEKISILEIFEESLKKVHKIIAVTIIQVLPMLIPVLIILGAIFYFIFFQFLPLFSTFAKTTGSFILPLAGITGMATIPYDNNQITPNPQLITQLSSVVMTILLLILVGIIVGFICFYFTARLWLSLPILMIENLGCIESLKKSWQMTKGKFWSIFVTILLISLVVGLMTGTINFVVNIIFSLGGGEFATIGSSIGSLINYLIFTPISAILAPLYYYNVKLEKE